MRFVRRGAGSCKHVLVRIEVGKGTTETLEDLTQRLYKEFHPTYLLQLQISRRRIPTPCITSENSCSFLSLSKYFASLLAIHHILLWACFGSSCLSPADTKEQKRLEFRKVYGG